MALWPDAAAAVAELRQFLSDGPSDRHVKDKKVLLPVDGTNVTFQTLEDRLVTPAAGSPIPAPGVIVRVDYQPVTVSSVDYLGGLVTLATAPPGSADVKAEYYYQFFLDIELTNALELASSMIIGGPNYLLIADTFKMATLYLAASVGYQKQAARWVERITNKYMLQEQPLDAETMGRSNLFQSLANNYYKQGISARDDFYTRQGRRNAPAWRQTHPRIPPVGPIR